MKSPLYSLLDLTLPHPFLLMPAQPSMNAFPDAAIRALTPSQLAFLEHLPKAELHAHLNGSIPLPILRDLAREYASSPATSDDVLAGVQRLQAGNSFTDMNDIFFVFPVAHALTSTPTSLKRATRAVLSHFLDPDSTSGSAAGSVEYIELRTTPRVTPHMSRRVYLEMVLDEIEARAPDAAALIVSLDRRMTPDDAQEVLALAVQLRREGRRVVGIDLCGDPKVRFYISSALLVTVLNASFFFSLRS
jgi:adenosine deaminase